MTIFIDDMYRYPMGQYGRMKMSHMIADTDTELHAMAQKIGVARRHFQDDHYDVCQEMRALAVQFGVVEITLKQCSAMVMMKRAGRRMGEPATAIDRWTAWRHNRVKDDETATAE